MQQKHFSILFLSILVLLFTQCSKINEEYTCIRGRIFGTYYSITYLHPKKADLQTQIEEKLSEFDNSLSTFNPNSVISRINANDTAVAADDFFSEMYQAAYQVSENTDGAFDITVAPLVNAWGFGFGNQNLSSLPDLDTIMPYIGYKKIRLENNRIIKEDRRIMLDASAIAKGQGCDVIAALLEKNGIKNYMVEIGGEIACKGLNPKGEKWRIGIDKPVDDPANENPELETVLVLSDVGLATSGNYRQFYMKDGKKYAHTINPKTGRPTDHNLLSVTVIAPNCMQADAYATAFMVLGVERSLEICNQFDDMECYLIYSDKDDANKIAYSNGFEKYFAE